MLAKLPADTFSLSKSRATQFLDVREQLEAAQDVLNDLRQQYKQINAEMEKSVRAAANQLKSTINIPGQVLTMLRIVSGGEPSVDRVAAQAPALKLTVELGVVKARYIKHGHQGVDVYSCRTGETDFTLLGRYSLSRFEDARPTRTAGQPEQRQYYAVYVDKDQPVGSQSPTASVVVGSRPGQ